MSILIDFFSFILENPFFFFVVLFSNFLALVFIKKTGIIDIIDKQP